MRLMIDNVEALEEEVSILSIHAKPEELEMLEN